MRQLLRKLKFLLPLLPYSVVNRIKKSVYKKELEEWKQKGCPVPPPHMVKQLTIAGYQQQYGYDTLVETGTFMGEMVEAQKKNFKEIISIEIGDDLFEKAKQRFRQDKNIKLIHGDSGKMLPQAVKAIAGPAIFWLDGHYSNGITAMGDTECPIFEELDSIFNNNNQDHILLIDDARCFTGQNDYPTVEKLSEYVKRKKPSYDVQVKDDIIRCIPAKTA